MKNINAIDKIIASCAMKDFLRYNPHDKNGKPKYKKYRPYSLSPATMEAQKIKSDYLHDLIDENEYKAYCLKYNLLNQEA